MREPEDWEGLEAILEAAQKQKRADFGFASTRRVKDALESEKAFPEIVHQIHQEFLENTRKWDQELENEKHPG